MNSRVLFLSVMLLLACIELTAQPNKKLTGLWRVQVSRSIDLMDPSCRARFDTLSAGIKDRAIKAMTDREFIFFENGNVTVNWTSRLGPRVSTGSWVIDKPSGELFITIGNGATGFSYEFQSLTALILRGKKEKGLFNNLYLKKIK